MSTATTTSTVADAARAWHHSGCAVLPVKTDGSKAPAVTTWTGYQKQAPNTDQVNGWFGNGHPGLGLICGTVSGGLEMVELEGRAVAEGALTELTELIKASGLEDLWLRITRDGYAEVTPSGGLHLLYRLTDTPVPGNTKLAMRPANPAELQAKPKEKHVVLAETRGEGGFVVIAPSHGTTHPTGQPWELRYGQPGVVPTITGAEREQLHRAFRALDRTPAPTEPAPARRLAPVRTDGDLSPGDDFETRADWSDPLLLGGAGWTPLYTHGGRTYWRRPGKTTPGMSATTGGAADGRDRLYVFSSATEFDTETPYTKFGAYAQLHHGGDHSAAAKELRRQGFGSQRPASDYGAEERAAIAELAPGAARALAAIDGTAARALPEPAPNEQRKLQLFSDPEAIRDITTAINHGALPNVYVTNGELHELVHLSGDVSAAGLTAEDTPPLPVASVTMGADRLAAALADHTYTYEVRTKKDEFYEVEVVPAPKILNPVLSRRHWPGVPPLHGIVGSPVLRPDGTLIQAPGYDPATGLYLASKVDLPHVPEKPTADQVNEALEFLLHQFLGDFPWVSEADRANYIGLLVAQILRPYLRTLTPFGMITASTQSSGKSILSSGIGLLYGQRVRPWVRSETELRKSITAVLTESASTIVFDNIREGEAIASPVLAMLVTAPTWTDRVLGSSENVTIPNDRLWLATGNNLRLGGDMATRTVAVRLDPKIPRPELRDAGKFTIPNLDQWVARPDNRTHLLWRLLVLVMDWMGAGAPRDSIAMRQFSPWASATGGLLAHHGIHGFLANANDVRELDEEDAEWGAFLARWHQVFASSEVSSRKLRDSANVEYEPGRGEVDRWLGGFLTDEDGKLPSVKSLGRLLRGQIGRFHDEYVLQARYDKASKTWMWRVERHDEAMS